MAEWEIQVKHLWKEATLKRHPDKGGLQGKFPATSACPFGGSYVVGAIQGNCEEIGGAISEWSLPYATAFAVELAQHTKRKTAAWKKKTRYFFSRCPFGIISEIQKRGPFEKWQRAGFLAGPGQRKDSNHILFAWKRIWYLSVASMVSWSDMTQTARLPARLVPGASLIYVALSESFWRLLDLCISFLGLRPTHFIFQQLERIFIWKCDIRPPNLRIIL